MANCKPAGPYYTAVYHGDFVEFWDDDCVLFTTTPSTAATQEQRDELARIWSLAVGLGEASGRELMKGDFRRLLEPKRIRND